MLYKPTIMEVEVFGYVGGHIGRKELKIIDNFKLLKYRDAISLRIVLSFLQTH